MISEHKQHAAASAGLLALALHIAGTKAQLPAFTFDSCEQKVLSILNGTYSEGGINNETIARYIYTGPVRGLKPSCPRSDILTLTLEGCWVLCGDNIEVTEPTNALSLTATWIFPLAILLNLPYESHHGRKVRKTLESVSNWLGSPQSALTATIWNFRQIRWCHRRSKDGDLDRDLSNAYYVLSCLNQFDLGDSTARRPKSSDEDSIELSDLGEGGLGDADHGVFFQALVYSLFRPTASIERAVLDKNHGQPPLDVILTRQLLSHVAFQLRMLRRRGVKPTLASLGTFLIAFVFSTVLAFGNLGEHADMLSLSIGLLVMWLPVLVIFTIVDRNPISSKRSAEILSRWLYNANAVMEWAERQALNPRADTQSQIRWWDPPTANQSLFPVGEFVGQGRKMQYCGVPHAVLTSTGREDQFGNKVDDYRACGRAVYRKLQGHKPFSWYVTAAVSFLLVWTEIMMAVMFAFNTPTIGPGCWSGSCFLFGVLSSVGWLVQFQQRPRPWTVVLAHVFNGLALVWLVATIVMQITGVFTNCWCLCAPVAWPTFGGYMDFGNALVYRTKFTVLTYWISASVVGGLVPIIAFVTAVFWWLKCQHLWAANERRHRGHEGDPARVNLDWLQ